MPEANDSQEVCDLASAQAGAEDQGRRMGAVQSTQFDQRIFQRRDLLVHEVAHEGIRPDRGPEQSYPSSPWGDGDGRKTPPSCWWESALGP